MLEVKKDRSEELRKAILQLNIFSEIDGNLLDYNDGYIKNFLHTLCPKHIYDIDEIIKKTPINKERLKKIIENSIYDELNAVLKPDHNINQASFIIDVGGYQILTQCDGYKHSVGREVNNAHFEYIPETNSYSFSDHKRKFFIQTRDGNNGEILIKDYNNIVKQKINDKINDDNLTKLAKKCLVFLKSVSLVELKKYYQTFTSNIKQEKEEKLPSPKTIISAMQKAQEDVEQMRNKEKENKREGDEKNGNNDIKIIIEKNTESIKNNTKNTGLNNNNSWKNWFKTTSPFRECYNCCCGEGNEVDSNQIVISGN